MSSVQLIVLKYNATESMTLLRLEAKPKEKKCAIDPETAMAGKCTARQVSRRGNPVFRAVNLGNQSQMHFFFSMLGYVHCAKESFAIRGHEGT